MVWERSSGLGRGRCKFKSSHHLLCDWANCSNSEFVSSLTKMRIIITNSNRWCCNEMLCKPSTSPPVSYHYYDYLLFISSCIITIEWELDLALEDRGLSHNCHLLGMWLQTCPLTSLNLSCLTYIKGDNTGNKCITGLLWESNKIMYSGIL